MHVLISHDDFGRRMLLKIACKRAGFQVTSTGSRAVAEACVRNSVVDVLVVAERVEGKLTHSLSLLAECRNKMVETILLTHRNDPNVDELFSLLPSLHCLVGAEVAPKLIAKLAISAVKGATDRSKPFLLSRAIPVDKVSDKTTRAFASCRQQEPQVQLQEFA